MQILHLGTCLKIHSGGPSAGDSGDQGGRIVAQQFPLFTVNTSTHIVGVRACSSGIDCPDALRVGVREAFQQERIHNRKNCRIGTDSKRKGKNYRNGETGVPCQHSQAKAKVLPEMIPPEPAAGFVEALFHLHDIAERATCYGSGLRFTQPLFSQALALLLYVCFNFGAKVACLPLPSEHCTNPPLRGLVSARWLPPHASLAVSCTSALRPAAVSG